MDLPNHKSFNDAMPRVMDDIRKAIDRGVIELQTDVFPGTCPDVPHAAFVGIISPLGATSKKDSDELRPYIDLTISGLNDCMTSLALRLPTIEATIPHLQPGMVLAKVDFRHGFHHMVMHPDDRRRMGIRLPDGRLARFKGMPFGSSQAPAIFCHMSGEFTRLLAARLDAMGLSGMVLVIYLDDLLLAAATWEALCQARQALHSLAAQLGIKFKATKQDGLDTPTQTLEYLGVMLDTTGGEVRAYPTAAKCNRLRLEWAAVLEAGYATTERLMTLLGKLAFVAGATRQLRVFAYPLHRALDKAGSWHVPTNTRIHLEPQLRGAVKEMLAYLTADNPLFHLRPAHTRGLHVLAAAEPPKFLLTDASGDTGYGYASAHKAGMGVWQADELHMAIHAKELAAVVMGLAAHAEEFTNHPVVIWSDNQAVVHVLNTFKPHATTVGHLRAVVDLQIQFNILLSAAFIPTELNTTADWLSRMTVSAQTTDFALRPRLFVACGGYRCNTVLCADDAGRSAEVLLGGKGARRRGSFCSPTRCMFQHARWLQGRSIWFNPPFPLIEATLQLLRRVHQAAPYRTYLLGCLPDLPDRRWFTNLVGPGKLFSIKKRIPAGSTPFIRMHALRGVPFANLANHAWLHEHELLGAALPFDLV